MRPLRLAELAQPVQAGERRGAGEQLDQDVAEAGQVRPRRALGARQHLGSRVGGRAGRRRGASRSSKAAPMSISLALPGALEHDVRRLDVAVDDPLAVQGRERRQAVAQDRDRDPRLEPRLRPPRR